MSYDDARPRRPGRRSALPRDQAVLAAFTTGATLLLAAMFCTSPTLLTAGGLLVAAALAAGAALDHRRFPR